MGTHAKLHVASVLISVALALEPVVGSSLSHPPSSMSTEAVLRGFYVFAGIGAILLAYIIIKLVRIRNRRAPGKYRVLSHADDQEMFPLAAGDGEDEEIFNAAHHQLRK
ncbi:hypothetical protein GWK47_029078 [Chionoecetes opilio]|uniref:Uncharacterized protein n=1 Tax=Chionoecetes opilio TaxID=41210 RepID=A0A8J4YKV7_CHIOP|nr:hypothetical protein GWK47_029078 [Chionoecetes opilio]